MRHVLVRVEGGGTEWVQAERQSVNQSESYKMMIGKVKLKGKPVWNTRRQIHTHTLGTHIQDDKGVEAIDGGVE